MMRLHHSDELEPLLDALADALGGAVDDPFGTDLVVVPSLGMRDAVTAGLARRLGESVPGAGDGVLANVEFEFPGRFIARALGDTPESFVLPDDPWHIERLTWAIVDVMSSDKPELPRERAEDELWAYARQIADLFDRYGTQRPQLIRAWANGDDSDASYARQSDGSTNQLPPEHLWQPALWRAVRRRLGVSSASELMPTMLAQLRAGEIEAMLPQRICLFGFGTLPTGVLSVARAVSAVREVHAFVRHPSQTGWSTSPHRLAGSLQVRNALDVTSHVANPLLASWGRSSLEAVAVLNGIDDIEQVPVSPAVPEATTLLRAVQRGIRLDLEPQRHQVVAPTDGSLQVHACHGDVRQLEVLRDAIGHALVADPTLAAHDVLVVSPRLDAFAPLVESVFSRGRLPLPVRVGDRSLTSADPLGDALVSILDAVSGRATLSQVLGLLQHESIRDRIGWDADEVEQVATWAADLGARWGLDTHHRVAWALPAEVSTGTWRSLVDRLLLGVAMPAPTARLGFGGMSPHDDIGTDEAVIAGELAEFVSRLVDAHRALAGSRPVGEWVDVLHGLVDSFLVESADEPWGRRSLHRLLDSLEDAARINGATCAVALHLSDMLRMLRRAIAERPGRLRLRTGAVTVTSMVPVQAVPARIVCILGLDDGALRSGTFDGDDVLGLNQCVGERHPRYESRQLLLDAVASAGDRLLITCNGADLTTNKQVPFAVALVELLDVVDAIAGCRSIGEEEEADGVVVRHRRHGFNEKALVPGGLVRGAAQAFTFDEAMLAAALARRATAAAPEVATTWELPAVYPETLDADLLVESIGRPARVYLQNRLDVRLPAEPSTEDEGLPLGVDALEFSALGRTLLDTRRRGGSSDDWKSAAVHDGALPPQALGTLVLDRVTAELDQLAALADSVGAPLSGSTDLKVTLPVPHRSHGRPGPADRGAERSGMRIVGTLGGVHLEETTARLVEVEFRRLRPSHRLALAVRLALAQLTEPGLEWSAVLVARAEQGPKVTSCRLRLRGDDPDGRRHSATTLLDLAVQVSLWSLRDAVPLFDAASASLAERDFAAAANELDNSLPDAHRDLLWPDLSLAGLLADPVHPADPAAVADVGRSTGASRAVATAMWVWRTYAETVAEESTDASPAPAGGAD